MRGVTGSHLAYLQRAGAPPALPSGFQGVHDHLRSSLWVRAIGVDDNGGPAMQGADTEQPDSRSDDQQQQQQPAQRTDLLAGLHGLLVPVSFGLTGDGAGVRVEVGTWSAQANSAAARLGMRTNAIASVLAGMYPSVELEPAHDTDVSALDTAGLVVGVPSPAGAIPGGDRTSPIDRVVRAMLGTHWAVRILAYPLDDAVVTDAVQALLNSARMVESAAKSEGGPNPLSQQYLELVKERMRSLTDAGAGGGWQTAVYLMGDEYSYPRLSSVWRSVYAARANRSEPVRIFHFPQVKQWARQWAIPDGDVTPGPGGYRRPFERQTLLSSAELGRYVRLPQCETVGFSVRSEAVFDVEPPRQPPDTPLLVLGQVMRAGKPLAPRYTLAVSDLARHVFVTGVTGAGKTNTIFALLEGAHQALTPFLVLEPAKAEYRRLMRHPRIGADLQVFTLSDETVSPLRFNPFEVEPGTSVQMHLDLLRSLFVASFGMWDPLPQVLERCLFEIYADRGWDVSNDANPRLGETYSDDDRSAAFPTLTDLVAKAEEVITDLGYEDKISDNLRAALVTRVNALRIGGKGAMLDTQRSTASDELFTRPTVVELERLGDDDDKAFLMGLVLIKLAEYRRARGYHDEVQHLLVIEEAHRLLANTAAKSTEFGGDPKTKAVTAFANLLAEIRVYGLGVVIADQVPVKLAPDVIKNTNLKIVHRLVAEDDRKAVGGTMAMRPPHMTALTTLARGTAAMFSEGDDAPILVRPPHVKDLAVTPTDREVAEHMRGRIQVSQCPAGCPTDSAECRAAASLADDKQIRNAADRAFSTAIALPGEMASLWQEVVDCAAPAVTRRPHLEASRIWPCLASRLSRAYAARRGAAAGWSYSATTRLAQALTAAILAEPAAADRLADIADEISARTADPFPRCSFICGPVPGPCRYRFDAARMAASSEVKADITYARGISDPDDRHDALAAVAAKAAKHVVRFKEYPDLPWAEPGLVMQLQASMCVAQQAILNIEDLTRSDSIDLLDKVCATAAPRHAYPGGDSAE